MKLKMNAVTLLVVLLYIISLVNSDIAASSSSTATLDRVILDTTSSDVLAEATFALDELMKLSDSRVYTSLSLNKIHSAELLDGIYHVNMIMKLELSSPYYKSKKESEIYELIVMRHKEDGIKSIAIDEFPVMEEHAIEEYYILKIKEKRKLREESLRRLQIEWLYFDHAASTNDEIDMYELPNNIEIKKDLDEKDVTELLNDFDSRLLKKERVNNSNMFCRRVSGDMLLEEKNLSTMSLGDLYGITIHDDSSDYQVYRAMQLLQRCIDILIEKKTESVGSRTV